MKERRTWTSVVDCGSMDYHPLRSALPQRRTLSQSGSENRASPQCRLPTSPVALFVCRCLA